MNQFINQQLDKVLQLNEEMNLVIKRLKTLKTKRLGSHQLKITDEEREMKIEKVRKIYHSKIGTVYKNMNLTLKAAGYKELINPYEPGKKGEA